MSLAMDAAAKNFLAATPDRLPIEDYVAKLDRMGRLTPLVLDMVRQAEQHRANNDVIMYLAGPLTGMPEEVKDRYVTTSELVAARKSPAKMFGYAPHLHGTDPVRHPDVTPNEVRDIDYLFARVVADGHINFWHPIAHGNSIEEGWAEENGIPSLYVVPESVKLSLLPRGMHNIAGMVLYEEFESNALPAIGEYLDAIEDGYGTAIATSWQPITATLPHFS